ncbi:hypothetical protein CPT_Moabite_257 [Serratia phage Moabite]|uniref:Uncharacterized protein n=1 Tax=Serratia phage Moabite TaxID=2587814 RepID=A0A4Y5TPI6_9CAUD|nr:hypothetical protein HWC48_gp159 [Serratia phage Moabite]QDB71287.1 hypothetical protein CPT_Moabite_257 [Serratia phage Moabite]UGO54140.1 hypothetical protein HAYMO_158 [Serratia phage vB_SmaM_Haymo]
MYLPITFDLLREKSTGTIVEVTSSDAEQSTISFVPVIDKEGNVITSGVTDILSLEEMVKQFELLENLSYFNVREEGQMDFGSMVVVKDNDEVNKLMLAYYEYMDQPMMLQYLEIDVEWPALAVVMNQALFVESVNKVSKLIQTVKG